MKKSILAYVIVISALGGSVAFAEDALPQQDVAKSKYAAFIENLNLKISNIKLPKINFKKTEDSVIGAGVPITAMQDIDVVENQVVNEDKVENENIISEVAAVENTNSKKNIWCFWKKEKNNIEVIQKKLIL